MWYRKDLLDAAGVKPPKTWDEWEEQTKMFTKGSGDSKQYGTMIPAGKNRYTSMFLTMMMWGAGGTYFDKDYKVTFNNPGTIKALEFMKRDVCLHSSRTRKYILWIWRQSIYVRHDCFNFWER